MVRFHRPQTKVVVVNNENLKSLAVFRQDKEIIKEERTRLLKKNQGLKT